MPSYLFAAWLHCNPDVYKTSTRQLKKFKRFFAGAGLEFLKTKKQQGLRMDAAIGRHESPARMKRAIRDGVLVLEVLGPATRSSLAALLGAPDAAPDEARAFCLRLDRALWLLGDECLDALGAWLPQMSGALVVAPLALEMAQGHALRMARQGVVRAAFTELGAALAFSARQAALAGP
jgi:hypothetical protein